MFNQQDIQQIEDRGATLRQVKQQIEQFKNGFPWMKIVGPATPERGIKVLDASRIQEAIDYYKKADIKGKCKFVPASGAASRMFKDMFSGLEKLEAGESLPAEAPGAQLSAHIKCFAFYTKELFGEPEDSAAYQKATLRKLLKEDGVVHGCTCLEAGTLLDVFSPMREDFLP